MKELSQMKEQAGQKNQPRDKATMDMGLFKKKIKKDEKEQKYLAKQTNNAE